MATKSENANRSYSARAGDLFDRARKEATTSRLVAAGALTAGAAAYAVFRDPVRRERIKTSARDYMDRGSAWWHGKSDKTATVADIAIPR